MSETVFTVNEPRYKIGLSEKPVLEFDPQGTGSTAGALYTLWNAGNVSDSFTVAIVAPVTNVNSVKLFVSVVSGITPTSMLTGTRLVTKELEIPLPAKNITHTQPITLIDNLEPCGDPQSGKCQIVRLVIVTSNNEDVTGNPARLKLALVPQNGKGEPVELLVEIRKYSDKIPAWLYYR